jgi:hypothetical protein
MIKGAPKADGVALYEVPTLSFKNGTSMPVMAARFAYVVSSSGATTGWVDFNMWSRDTMAALDNLRQCMEVDAAAALLTNVQGVIDKEAGGIADYLSSEDGVSQA